MPLIIGIGVVLLLVIAISWFQNRAERKRREQLKAQAEALGFQYSEDGDPRLLQPIAASLLLNQGVSGHILNVLRPGRAASSRDGETGTPEPEVAVFEYAFDVPAGRFVRSWPQTIVCLTSDSLSWPRFSVMPTAVFDVLAAKARNKEMRETLTGSAGLVLHEHPTFASQRHVMAFDRQKVRNLLTDDLVAFYEAHPDLCTEGGNNTLIFYVFDKVLKAQEIPTFLDQALEVFGLLRTKLGNNE